MKKKMIKNSKNTFEAGVKKNKNVLFPLRSLLGVLFLAMMMVFTSCEKDDIEPDNEPNSILPDRFAVEIPGSISNSNPMLKSSQVDTLNGNHIYQHLRTFISVGENAAEMAQGIMLSIATLNLNRPLELTFISDEDGRTKHLKIIENAMFEDESWQYRLTIYDAEGSEQPTQADIGLQVFWSWDPLKGIAMINPYNMDRDTEEIYANTSFRIDYSEVGNLGYEAHMFVSVTGYPLGNPLQDPFAMDNMKMFVGVNGDMVTVYGNSQHPNAQFFNDETGFNWAFVAAASESQDIAVAEVGLPPVGLDASDRETLLETYSIYNVFSDQVLSVWPTIDPEILNAYLYNTQAPGYFNSNGFVQAGTQPSEDYDELEAQILTLSPFSPALIESLSVDFAE
ncbi:MAG: hypothetical protein ACOC12_07960 [Bacteroidota bacterium]